MGIFLPDEELFKGRPGPKEPETYIERLARAQADLVLQDFRNGVDKFKANQRMIHRLNKIKRRLTKDKDYKEFVDKMNAYIRNSSEFRAPRSMAK